MNHLGRHDLCAIQQCLLPEQHELRETSIDFQTAKPLLMHLNVSQNLGGVIIRGFTFLHCVMFGLYLLVSVSYWSPVTASRLFGATSSNAPAAVMLMLLFLVHILAACVEFFFNFSIRPYNLNTFNSIDNFYDPAPCGQSRPLKSGILLKAQIGKMYQVTWVSARCLTCRVVTLGPTN